jgi:hypothetical protein
MLTVFVTTNTPKLARYTGLFAGTLVTLYITFEAPLSGQSMNPARTFASALSSGIWTHGWIYFTAPVLGTFWPRNCIETSTIPRLSPVQSSIMAANSGASSAAIAVAQIGNLLLHRLAAARGRIANDLRIANPRYSRRAICARSGAAHT